MKIEIMLGNLNTIEKEVILETYKLNKYNKTHTAKYLGIGIRTLQRKLKHYEGKAKVTSSTFNKLNIKESSYIREAHYNNNTLELQVSFKTGEVYSYEDVPQKTTKEFEQSESSGSYFSGNIIKQFKFIQV